MYTRVARDASTTVSKQWLLAAGRVTSELQVLLRPRAVGSQYQENCLAPAMSLRRLLMKMDCEWRLIEWSALLGQAVNSSVELVSCNPWELMDVLFVSGSVEVVVT